MGPSNLVEGFPLVDTSGLTLEVGAGMTELDNMVPVLVLYNTELLGVGVGDLAAELYDIVDSSCISVIGIVVTVVAAGIAVLSVMLCLSDDMMMTLLTIVEVGVVVVVVVILSVVASSISSV